MPSGVQFHGLLKSNFIFKIFLDILQSFLKKFNNNDSCLLANRSLLIYVTTQAHHGPHARQGWDSPFLVSTLPHRICVSPVPCWLGVCRLTPQFSLCMHLFPLKREMQRLVKSLHLLAVTFSSLFKAWEKLIMLLCNLVYPFQLRKQSMFIGFIQFCGCWQHLSPVSSFNLRI